MTEAETERLNELKARIIKEERYRGPYSHNIVTLALQEIDRKFGPATASRVMKELKLNKRYG